MCNEPTVARVKLWLTIHMIMNTAIVQSQNLMKTVDSVCSHFWNTQMVEYIQNKLNQGNMQLQAILSQISLLSPALYIMEPL